MTTGETTFFLIHGAGAIIPTEIGLRLHRTQYFDKEDNQKALRLNLDLIDKLRETNEIRNAARAKQVARYYNSKVRKK